MPTQLTAAPHCSTSPLPNAPHAATLYPAAGANWEAVAQYVDMRQALMKWEGPEPPPPGGALGAVNGAAAPPGADADAAADDKAAGKAAAEAAEGAAEGVLSPGAEDAAATPAAAATGSGGSRKTLVASLADALRSPFAQQQEQEQHVAVASAADLAAADGQGGDGGGGSGADTPGFVSRLRQGLPVSLGGKPRKGRAGEPRRRGRGGGWASGDEEPSGSGEECAAAS